MQIQRRRESRPICNCRSHAVVRRLAAYGRTIDARRIHRQGPVSERVSGGLFRQPHTIEITPHRTCRRHDLIVRVRCVIAVSEPPRTGCGEGCSCGAGDPLDVGWLRGNMPGAALELHSGHRRCRRDEHSQGFPPDRGRSREGGVDRGRFQAEARNGIGSPLPLSKGR